MYIIVGTDSWPDGAEFRCTHMIYIPHRHPLLHTQGVQSIDISINHELRVFIKKRRRRKRGGMKVCKCGVVGGGGSPYGLTNVVEIPEMKTDDIT